MLAGNYRHFDGKSRKYSFYTFFKYHSKVTTYGKFHSNHIPRFQYKGKTRKQANYNILLTP